MIRGALARRFDRLARRAHAFHRFAHHPLCDRYAGELIALGRRRRVCRGCACAFLGALVGCALGFAIALDGRVAYVVAAGSIAGAAMSVSRQHHSRRLGKLWTRALPAAGLAAVLGGCLRVRDAHSLAVALGILGATYTLQQYYRRRGPDRSPCSDCHERTLPVPCSGFRDIVRAERAFVRRSHALLDAFVRSSEPRAL